jgi:hypothetical protein
VHGLAVPVHDAAGRDREPDVVEDLERDGTDVVGAVLVADDHADPDLAEGLEAALVVGLGQLRIEAFEDPLADAALLR